MDIASKARSSVHEYQLEPVRLTVETDRRVYYRGEEIEGKIRASFYYGAPLAGREIRLSTGRRPDDHSEDRRKRRGAFQVPNPRFPRNPNAAAGRHAARAEFCDGAELLSRHAGLFVQSQTRCGRCSWRARSFEVTDQDDDAEGKPLAQKLTLHVLERTVVDGKVGESEVEQHDLTTDEGGNRPPNAAAGKGGPIHPAGRRDRPLQESGHRPAACPHLRRQRPGAAADPGRPAHVQSRRHGRGAAPLARGPGPGAGHVPRRRVLDYKLVQLETGRTSSRSPCRRSSRRISIWTSLS